MKNKHAIKIIAVILAFCSLITQFPAITFAAPTKSDGRKIMVSMGDSYSSGEGVEPFYDQELSWREKNDSTDFMAHRSKHSWPGMLYLDGQQNEKDVNWYFVAASGAETKHFKEQQFISTDRLGTYYCPYLDPQLKVFDNFEKNEVDYVTMTIGGNDVGFSDIITTAVVEMHGFLNPVLLQNKLNKAWNDYYNNNVPGNIKKTYQNVRKATGDQTQIIVAGYPMLISENPRKNPFFSSAEAKAINKSVKKFNNFLSEIVTELNDGIDEYGKPNKEKADKRIHFVTVADEFGGHEAYSKDTSFDDMPFINGIMDNMPQDLKKINKFNLKTYVSAYSMHPNANGTIAYAKCVQKVIDDIEGNTSNNSSESTTSATTTSGPVFNVGDWRQAYIDFLKNYMNEAENPDDCGFNLVYIDNDDTPELVIREGTSHSDAASVYTCVNSQVIDLLVDLGGNFGNVGYVEREGLIFEEFMYGGSGYTTIYRLDSGTCTELISLFSNAAAVSPGETPTYKINDVTVSESEYYDAWDDYDDYDVSYSADNDMPLTLDSINSIANY